MDSLASEDKGAVAELAKLLHQFIAHTGHGARVVRPTAAVFDWRTGVFNFSVKRFTFERFFEEQLRKPHTVREDGRDDERCKEDTSNNG